MSHSSREAAGKEKVREAADALRAQIHDKPATGPTGNPLHDSIMAIMAEQRKKKT